MKNLYSADTINHFHFKVNSGKCKYFQNSKRTENYQVPEKFEDFTF